MTLAAPGPWLVLLALLWPAPPARAAGRQEAAATAVDLKAAVDALGSFKDAERMNAARAIRRAPGPQAVAALLQAVAEHRDGFVRFRALVLLTGFDDPRTRDVMAGLLHDPNDRLRSTACEYFEYHPDPQTTAELLKALPGERAEFVRPALARALAAAGSDPRVRDTLAREVGRGEDVYRSAVIEALGDYHAEYAVTPLLEVAGREGPLQGDAVLALGKIGDKRVLPVLAGLQRTAPQEEQPLIAAAICMLGVNCDSHLGYLERTLRFGEATPGYQPLLRSAASALGAVAGNGNAAALTLLLGVGIPARDPVRAPLALALGAVALRNPDLLLLTLEPRQDLAAAIDLLRDGFDMLEEDLAKEEFFAKVRHAYWQASDGTAAKKVAGQLIQQLEF